MKKIIEGILFIAILQLHAAHAGQSKLMMQVGCSVTRASIAGFSTTPVVHKYCTATNPGMDSSEKNLIGEYAISCPPGTEAKVTYRFGSYDENTGKIYPVNPQDPNLPIIFQDAKCKEVWRPDNPIHYAFCKDKLCYHKALFCKTKNAEGKDKKYYVVEIDINY